MTQLRQSRRLLAQPRLARLSCVQDDWHAVMQPLDGRTAVGGKDCVAVHRGLAVAGLPAVIQARQEHDIVQVQIIWLLDFELLVPFIEALYHHKAAPPLKQAPEHAFLSHRLAARVHHSIEVWLLAWLGVARHQPPTHGLHMRTSVVSSSHDRRGTSWGHVVGGHVGVAVAPGAAGDARRFHHAFRPHRHTRSAAHAEEWEQMLGSDRVGVRDGP
mmetsp:Transcript_1567/g.3971  ORF Transcript_1567/g.3971 Transcript_1567/m.3971 type:complete len:215 (-) Transcript_1567:87-731(-)